MSLPADHFDALYAHDPDPWAFATSAYEREKYDRTVAALRVDGVRPGRALELGCSIGVLTARLAAEVDELVAIDVAEAALTQARERTAALPGVTVRRGALPADVPPGPWDLVVASEVLYYLDEPDLGRALDGLEAALVPGGRLLAVHYTDPAPSYPLQGEQVHGLLRRRPALRRLRGERGSSWRLDLFERTGA